MSLTRRTLLGSGATASLAALTGTATSPGFAASPAHPQRHWRRHHHRPVPLIDDRFGRLALPGGFSYTIVAVSGRTELVSGHKTPDRPDGAGAFPYRDLVRLVQNHEVSPKYGADNPVPFIPGTTYDPGLSLAGGCTVVEVTGDGRRRREWVGLSGTISNCAGGVTPWGTWLSCEEDETTKGTAFGGYGTAAKDHGYVFEVAPASPEVQHPKPIRAWGALRPRGGRRGIGPAHRLPDRGRQHAECSSATARSPDPRSWRVPGETSTGSSSPPASPTTATCPPGV